MKRLLALLICGLALLSVPAVTRAENIDPSQPTDVPVGCSFTLPEESASYAYRLSDGLVTSRVHLKANSAFTITPEGEISTLVLDWYTVPGSYTVSQLNAGGTAISEETITDGFLRRVISIDPSCASVTVSNLPEGDIGDVAAYSSVSPTSTTTQALLPAPTSVDLLILAVGPGDESKQFGALVPTYAKERGIKTAILYLSNYGKRARVDEALSGLASEGYLEYPIFGGYSCSNYDSYAMAAEEFNKTNVIKYLKAEIAALKPKVVVAHSAEDPVGSHQFANECVIRAVRESESVQKFYTFGAAADVVPTIVDMNTPLNAYTGKTAAEVAQAAYNLHVSQRVFGLSIDTTSAYTLAYTTVGEDEAKNDLFEHISTSSLLAYAPVSPSPAPTPEATAAPETADAPQAAMDPATSGNGKHAGNTEPGMLMSLNLSFGPVVICMGAGLALTVAMFLLLYRPIRTRRSKGDAVCICLIPLAVGLAASAVLAGASVKKQPSPEPVSAAASAAPESAPIEASAEPTATPAPSAEPTPDAVAAFEENYYRKEGDPPEVVVVDSEHGHWAYRSDDLGIDIDRISTTNDAGKPLTYYVADIHMKDITQFRPAFGSEGHTGRGAIYPWIMARRAKAVLWLTGDNLINSEKDEKGILIRDGRLFSDQNAEDTLAIYPDMSMRIFAKWEMRGQTLLEEGVENSYSFGPTLIKDGVINEDAKYHRVRRINPRAGIGYLEPGHYLAIVVDGRQKSYSVGMTIGEFADLFAEYGCSQAYNLDGGLSAGLIFMGEQLNSHSGNRIGASDDISYQRAVPDGLMFGYSNLVPSETDPINNNGNKQ